MDIFASIISGTIIFAIPLILVALGGMFSERSGIINIALEGIMIIGALVGCLVLKSFENSGFGANNPQIAMFLAILISAIVGAVYSLLLAFAAINLKANQTIGGTALNMFAPAFAIVLTWIIQGQGQTTILIPNWVNITPRTLGMPDSFSNGFFGTIIFKSLYLTTPIAIIVLIASHIILYKTKFGLRLRACGENPHAVDSVGVNVYKFRYIGVMISGALAAIGGIAFTVAAGTGFQSSVDGYGFLALAVLIFGNWKPIKIFLASLVFAFFKTIASSAKSIPFLPSFDFIKESRYIYLMVPYIVTLIVLAFTSKKTRAPKAEGIPYDKELR